MKKKKEKIEGGEGDKRVKASLQKKKEKNDRIAEREGESKWC